MYLSYAECRRKSTPEGEKKYTVQRQKPHTSTPRTVWYLPPTVGSERKSAGDFWRLCKFTGLSNWDGWNVDDVNNNYCILRVYAF